MELKKIKSLILPILVGKHLQVIKNLQVNLMQNKLLILRTLIF